MRFLRYSCYVSLADGENPLNRRVLVSLIGIYELPVSVKLAKVISARRRVMSALETKWENVANIEIIAFNKVGTILSHCRGLYLVTIVKCTFIAL
jgi:hypothetical protein